MGVLRNAAPDTDLGFVVTEPDDEVGGDELLILVIRVAKALVDRIRAERPAEPTASPMSPTSPMTPVHGLAARYLIGRENVTSVELGRYLGITKQSASEVVSALERTGLVRRAPHPSDGRARVLLLTDAGRARIDEGRRWSQEVEEEWAALVGRDRLEVVRDVFEAYLMADATARDARPPVDLSSAASDPACR